MERVVKMSLSRVLFLSTSPQPSSSSPHSFACLPACAPLPRILTRMFWLFTSCCAVHAQGVCLCFMIKGCVCVCVLLAQKEEVHLCACVFECAHVTVLSAHALACGRQCCDVIERYSLAQQVRAVRRYSAPHSSATTPTSSSLSARRGEDAGITVRRGGECLET